jgi:hypothetical protein
MPAALAPEHRDFFSRNHYIEFEEMLPFLDCEKIKEHIDQVLLKRTKKALNTQTPPELFAAGRDLFREDALIRKTVVSRLLAQTLSLLLDAPVIRIAYDEVLRTTEKTGSPLSPSASLQSLSALQSLVGGAVIRLTPDGTSHEFLPQKVGSVVFFRPDLPLPWPDFFQVPHQSFLLIAYAPERCLYVPRSDDPHGHALKKLGYGSGDPLNNSLHPIAFRREL